MSLTDKEVLILATDGLWDVLSNEEAARIVRNSLANADQDDYSRWIDVLLWNFLGIHPSLKS